MAYKLVDAQQAIIGAFTATVIFFAIKAGNPFFFNYKIGLAITGVLMWVYYKGFRITDKRNHFVINLILSFVVCSFFGVIFKLITLEQLYTTEVFGSLVIIGVWVAFPVAMLLDKFNFTNPIRRYYIRGK